MSDGPHRSLPLRRPWKEVAKRGDQRTYDTTQVAEAATLALVSDFRNEVSGALISALKNVFNGKENSLRLPEIALDQLEAAKSLAAGSVFGRNAVAWCIQLVHEGRTDPEAIYEAVGLAAKERGYAATRQVEEHFLRQASKQRAAGVCSRLGDAISAMSEKRLGTMLINPAPSQLRAPKKKISINDGVPL